MSDENKNDGTGKAAFIFALIAGGITFLVQLGRVSAYERALTVDGDVWGPTIIVFCLVFFGLLIFGSLSK